MMSLDQLVAGNAEEPASFVSGVPFLKTSFECSSLGVHFFDNSTEGRLRARWILEHRRAQVKEEIPVRVDVVFDGFRCSQICCAPLHPVLVMYSYGLVMGPNPDAQILISPGASKSSIVPGFAQFRAADLPKVANSAAWACEQVASPPASESFPLFVDCTAYMQSQYFPNIFFHPERWE